MDIEMFKKAIISAVETHAPVIAYDSSAKIRMTLKSKIDSGRIYSRFVIYVWSGKWAEQFSCFDLDEAVRQFYAYVRERVTNPYELIRKPEEIKKPQEELNSDNKENKS